MNPEANGTHQLPPQMSTLAPEVDWLYNFIYWVSVVSFLAMVGLMVYYVIKYRRRPGHKAEITGHSDALEIGWTVAPCFLLVYLFVMGWQGYLKGAIAPEDSIDIRVTGQQWAWTFEHSSGAAEINEVQVPVHTPVRFTMSSRDVLHSLYVPEFRVKRDLVPGMYTSLWFEATQLTPPDRPVTVFCTEYCGAPEGISPEASPVLIPKDDAPAECANSCLGACAQHCQFSNSNHSSMLARMTVETQEDYARFLEEGPPPPAECEGDDDPEACWGRQLYANAGCRSCHMVDGVTQAPGPNWVGLWGAQRQFADGTSRLADENYIRQSILQPASQIVMGYNNVRMNAFNLSENQLNAVIAYIRSLENGPGDQ